VRLYINYYTRVDQLITSTRLWLYFLFLSFSSIEVLVAMPMTRWEFRIVLCLAGGNASVTCLKMLVMRFGHVQ